jgi:hypothetical protein
MWPKMSASQANRSSTAAGIGPTPGISHRPLESRPEITSASTTTTIWLRTDTPGLKIASRLGSPPPVPVLVLVLAPLVLLPPPVLLLAAVPVLLVPVLAPFVLLPGLLLGLVVVVSTPVKIMSASWRS